MEGIAALFGLFFAGGGVCMVFLIAGFVVLVIVLIVVGAKQAAARRKALSEWATSHGLTFDAGHDHGFDERYPQFKRLKAGERNRYAYNIMRGSWQGWRVTAFDYHYATTSTDSKGRTSTTSHYFSAIIADTGLPLRPLLIRPEGFFDRVTEFFGYDDIDFESAEFSRRFFVKSPDRRWAFDVIHQETMEYLLGQPRRTIQIDGPFAIIHDNRTWKPPQFDEALGTLRGLIDRIPEGVLRELEETRT